MPSILAVSSTILTELASRQKQRNKNVWRGISLLLPSKRRKLVPISWNIYSVLNTRLRAATVQPFVESFPITTYDINDPWADMLYRISAVQQNEIDFEVLAVDQENNPESRKTCLAIIHRRMGHDRTVSIIWNANNGCSKGHQCVSSRNILTDQRFGFLVRYFVVQSHPFRKRNFRALKKV